LTVITVFFTQTFSVHTADIAGYKFAMFLTGLSPADIGVPLDVRIGVLLGKRIDKRISKV
jgi:hypothetical protein